MKSEVTLLLNAMRGGDVEAGAKMLPLVYAELRQLARAKMVSAHSRCRWQE